jgi:DegV family protein with EDD domain
MKVAIITDSGANLTKEVVEKHHNLFVIPLMIMVDGVGYRDQVEISPEEVYALLDEKTITTSLPTMDDLMGVLDQLKKEEYTDVLIINISSGLSGTFNAFRLAIEDFKGLNIHHYDTKTLAGGQGQLVELALELIQANVPLADVIERLNKQRYEDSMAIYTINTLKYLRRGGRIGKVEGTIGDVLHIKPIITVNEEGEYVTIAKSFGLQRTILKMKQLLADKFADQTIDLTIHYGDDFEKAEKLGNALAEMVKVRNKTISPLTPVLGIHTGPMMFAFIARKV